MLSFQRILSLIEVDRPVYDFKEIYTYHGISCVFRTNHQLHQEAVSQFFQYYYDHCLDHQDILALHTTDHYELYSFVEERTYLRLFDWIEEILLLQVGYFDDEIAEITFTDGGLVIDRQRRVILCYHHSLQNVYFISDGSDLSIKFEIIRTIREMITWRLEEKGYYLLQASAVVKEGKAILFCGGDGVGKTTFLLGLLERGYHLLSDGKVFIGVEDRKMRALAWPGSVGVTLASTMHFHPLIGIYADLGSLALPQYRIHSLALDQLEENEIDKVDLTAEETTLAFETKFVREAEVGQIFAIDDFMPYENLQLQEKEQNLPFFQQHFYFPEQDTVAESWIASSLPSMFQQRKRHHPKTINRYQLTLKILSRLPVKKLSQARFQSIEKKISMLEKDLYF